jgi:hypothetical protein
MIKWHKTTFVLAILLSIVICFLWLSSITTTFAQPNSQVPVLSQDNTPTPTPGPNGYPLTPSSEDLQQQYDEIATLQAEYNSQSIFDYHVAYLIKADTPPLNEITTPEKIAEKTGAQVVNTWDDFLKLNDEQPFQIVLVHISMYDTIDPEWMQTAYRNNVLPVGINFSHEQMVAMTGDKCLHNPNPHLKESDYTASFRYFLYSASLQNEQYREVVDKAELEDCNDDYKVGPVGVFHGNVQYRLENEQNLDGLIRGIISDTTNYYGR